MFFMKSLKTANDRVEVHLTLSKCIVRDVSTMPQENRVVLRTSDWRLFIADVKAGKFDVPDER